MLMAAGGVAVIITILLIFVYLLYVVLPLFASASIQLEASYSVPGGPAETLSLGTEEYANRPPAYRRWPGGVLHDP